MTARARLVLEDAHFALRMHGVATYGPAFRTSWLGIITQLRAVGHVLDKVDGPTDPRLAKVVTERWQELNRSKPEPAIFWGFIESERNRFLKNYEHGITRMRVIRGADPNIVMALDLANAGKGVQFGSAYNVPPEVPDRTVISIIADGPFAGQSEAAVAALALGKC